MHNLVGFIKWLKLGRTEDEVMRLNYVDSRGKGGECWGTPLYCSEQVMNVDDNNGKPSSCLTLCLKNV